MYKQFTDSICSDFSFAQIESGIRAVKDLDVVLIFRHYIIIIIDIDIMRATLFLLEYTLPIGINRRITQFISEQKKRYKGRYYALTFSRRASLCDVRCRHFVCTLGIPPASFTHKHTHERSCDKQKKR